ncbi:lysophospholipid acyltransferase family protein [Pontibacter roseus]|uniref:lysophospholipid acyltransferase family protein n=1 Tax=Pontibacter roseus TaxID=336989 RepID=UPI00035EB692|nr:lysophospholipid acyltransferase family protein [Pontibacter roseus]
MLYAILKLIYRIGLWVFFRRFEVRNRHLLPEQGPLLIVANHPNTFMDPIAIASLLRQQVYFIAKSTVFNSLFKKWLLQRMNLIPIHRREDAPDQPINNEETFRASNQALATGKTLLIFPEGNSFNERRLRKLKTGAARMALSAADAGLAANLKLLPVGLNYSAPTRFRSDVFVNVGQPIEVAGFLERYRQDGVRTVTELTEQMRAQLEDLIVVTPTDEEDELVRQIESVYKDRLAAHTPVTPSSQGQDFLLTKAIAKSLAHFISTQPHRVTRLQEKLRSYDRLLQDLGLSHVTAEQKSNSLSWWGVRTTLFLVAGFPVYLYGLLNNYLPYVLPARVANALTEEEEFLAPIMLSVGIFSFPLCYTLQAVLFWQLLPEPASLLLYLLSLPPAGFFTLQYWNMLLHARGRWRLLRLSLSKDSMANQLRLQRQEILDELDQARLDYLQQQANA